MLTLKEARKRVNDLKEMIGDAEAAHSAEDKLYRDFLEAIAAGDLAGDEAVKVAKVVLKTKKIDFPRWAG